MTEYLIAGEIITLLMLARAESILRAVRGYPSRLVFLAFILMVAIWPIAIVVFFVEFVRAYAAERKN